MTEKQRTILLVIFDVLTAAFAWFLFYVFRIKYIEETELIFKAGFFRGLAIVPIFWVLLYTLQGTYQNTFRQYRLKTIKQTLSGSLIGVIIVFFSVLLNDFTHLFLYQQYYVLFFVLFGLHFFITLIPRFIMTTIHVKRIHARKFGFKTLIIGGSSRAMDIYNELTSIKPASGHDLIGFVNINGSDYELKEHLPLLGHVDNINQILTKNEVEEVIIAIESSDHERLKGIITHLSGFNIRISLIPDAYDILSGQVQMSSIFGALLLTTNTTAMPDWQISTKRMIDIFFASIAMIVLLPVYLVLAVSVKLSSKGPVFFRQERVGLNRKPFKIIKFRIYVCGG